MTFPVVEAFVEQPSKEKQAKIGVCTNTQAPSMVKIEIPEACLVDVAVIGSLVVNRDGAERMIINSLAHPSLEYIILFGLETISFRPSTNLLLALMKGYDKKKSGNMIINGKGVSPHYPSVSEKLLDMFQKRITVIPLYTHEKCDAVVAEYVEWLRTRIPEELYILIKGAQEKDRFYDVLNKIIAWIAKQKRSDQEIVELDAKDFQHLQPPTRQVDGDESVPEVHFEVKQEGKKIVVLIDTVQGNFKIEGDDSFLMAYSITTYCYVHAITIPKYEQLLLGLEMSRVEVAIRNDIQVDSFVKSMVNREERKDIQLAPRPLLIPDKKYFYKIGTKNKKIVVQSMANDVNEEVFELQSEKVIPMLNTIATYDRFEEYQQSMLHRMDVGIETGRAGIAVLKNTNFFQDFRNLFHMNTTSFPLIVVDGGNFLANHREIITQVYTRGLTASHPDTHKGTMRSATVLGVFRNVQQALKNFPAVYSSGSQSVEMMRADYKKQLSSPECSGSYTYGQRTRAHFGKDQLLEAVAALKRDPKGVYVIQRFDPVIDMTLKETQITDAAGKSVRKRVEASKDPCLTHDTYFIANNKLHAFHIARAHNIVNAYPENIFGLHDAYDAFVAEKLGIPLGDMFMLSSRSNILLLTEEQKAKKIIAEPAVTTEVHDRLSGPLKLDVISQGRVVAYDILPLECEARVSHPCLEAIENYNGVNIVKKAIRYLKVRGSAHNNPVICSYDPKKEVVDEAHRLIFFQCNEQARKLYVTAVFMNGSNKKKKDDIKLCNYLATEFSRELNYIGGNLFLFYVPFENE